MESLYIGRTEIMISGTPVEIELWRDSTGHIQWIPTNPDIFNKGEYLESGTAVEGYACQIIISKYQ